MHAYMQVWQRALAGLTSQLVYESFAVQLLEALCRARHTSRGVENRPGVGAGFRPCLH